VAVDAQSARVFIPNNGANTVSMLDARTGVVLRTITVGPHPAKAVVDERTGRVFVVHGRGMTTGNVLGPQPTVESAVTVGVSVLDARTGALVRALPLPAGGGMANDKVGLAPVSNIAVDVAQGRVFVINQAAAGQASEGAGSVSVLDAQSGRLLRTIPVGQHPMSLAVDAVTARLFVVNTNAGCRRPFSPWDGVPAGVRQVLPFLPAPARPSCHRPGTVTVIDTSRL
jgi:YVTN family beta-propeller protein